MPCTYGLRSVRCWSPSYSTATRLVPAHIDELPNPYSTTESESAASHTPLRSASAVAMFPRRLGAGVHHVERGHGNDEAARSAIAVGERQDIGSGDARCPGESVEMGNRVMNSRKRPRSNAVARWSGRAGLPKSRTSSAPTRSSRDDASRRVVVRPDHLHGVGVVDPFRTVERRGSPAGDDCRCVSTRATLQLLGRHIDGAVSRRNVDIGVYGSIVPRSCARVTMPVATASSQE